eukprot:COSAG02_NODE_409_length_22892_cov_11.461150_13_plen_68_part_00
MSVPLSVFEAAGYADADAKKAKRKFDEQDVSLQHLANGDITQVLAVPPLHHQCATVQRCTTRCRPQS